MRAKCTPFVRRWWMNWESGWTELCEKHNCGIQIKIALFGNVMQPKRSRVFGAMRFIASYLQIMIPRELLFAA